jgi:hypothetical protein
MDRGILLFIIENHSGNDLTHLQKLGTLISLLRGIVKARTTEKLARRTHILEGAASLRRKEFERSCN